MNRFEGQRAIVTGAASGIGRAAALRLAAEGAGLFLADRDRPGLDAVTAEVGQAALQSSSLDIGDPQGVDAAFDGFADRHGAPDILIHCAGVVGSTGQNAVEADPDDFARTVAINLTGSFLVARAALRHMASAGYGRVLMLASMAGKDGNPGMAGYVASKAGVIGLTKALGKEYARAGITVNALAPAVIATPMNAATDPETVKMLVDKIPVGRFGTVDECAAIICWICSREASFNTGAIFDLSGGRAVY